MSQINGADDTASTPGIADQQQQESSPAGFWFPMALLMLAAVIRIPAFAYTGKRFNMLFFISEAVVILAVICAVERMIAMFNGESRLERLDFPARLTLCGQAILPMTIACLALSFLSQTVGNVAGWVDFDGERIFLRGIDGIAFDQMTDAGRVYSAALAGVLILFVIERGQRRALSLRRAGHAALHHAGSLLIGIILCALAMIWLSGLQESVRADVVATARTMDHVIAQNGLIALFAGGFACVRLVIVVAIFTLVLRASYRKKAAAA